jgi:predicted AlkP superfamily phosphohydrolase/phosphomutase
MGTRVAVLALDACEKDVLLRLADEGRAPTIDRLRRTGAYAPTVNPPGLFVGAVWPTIFTGTSPASHGRYCFRQHEAGTYEVRPTDVHRTVKRPPLWDKLSEAGRRSAIVDLPHSWLSPTINGVQIVDWGAHDANPGFRASNEELAAEIRAFGEHPVGVDCNGRRRSVEDWRLLRDQLLAAVEKRLELADLVLAKEDWDLFFFGFSEAHCIGHQAWCVHDPEHPRHDAAISEELGDPVYQVYEALDAAIGRLLDRLGPDTLTLIVCSHGMGAHYGGNHLLEQLLTRLDDADTPPAGRAVRSAAGWARRHAPAQLKKLRRRLRHGVVTSPGNLRPPGNKPAVIADAAWRRYFAVPNNDVCGAVRFNVVGREPHGRVRPEALDAACEQLTKDLLELVNVETGEPAVRRVLRTAEHYDGPLTPTLPDLIVEWNFARPIDGVRSSKAGTVTAHDAEERTGDHRPAGLLLATGPGVRPGMLPRTVRSEDIAPTVAAALGVELPDVDGHPIPEMLGNAVPS